MIDVRMELLDIIKDDPRYSIQAYEFLGASLRYTVENVVKEQRHVSGVQLLDGIRIFALEKFGMMAKTVFEQWGVAQTEDWGNIVFNMIAKGLLEKQDDDTIEDFKSLYDFENVFETEYVIEVPR